MVRGWIVLSGIAIFALGIPPAHGQAPDLEITLESGSDWERETEEQLRRIVAEYDVSRWLYTKRIHIQRGVTPTSHPVLTLNTRNRGDDHGLLSALLHEEFHWLEEARPEAREAAKAEFGQLFPDAPVGDGQGARSLDSTYLHLIVCDLEYQAMTLMVGEARAREVLTGMRFYRWIYRQVLDNPAVRPVNERHGFDASRGTARPN